LQITELVKQGFNQAGFLSGKVLSRLKACSCKVPKSNILFVHMYLFRDTSKTKVVSNYEGIHRIILLQVCIRFFKLGDLLGIEDVNASINMA
jgi:hypothetical protein